jgi:hypothetical protein
MEAICSSETSALSKLQHYNTEGALLINPFQGNNR